MPSTAASPVRNVRREGMDLLKKLEKDGKMSQDDHHKSSAKVQELTDKLDQGDRRDAGHQRGRDPQGLKPLRTAALPLFSVSRPLQPKAPPR